MNLTKEIILTRYEKGKIEETSDIVVREQPLTIHLNDIEIVTLLCSPKDFEYLSLGFLLSEGIIKEKSDIKSIKIDRDKGKAYVDIIENKDTTKCFLKDKVLTKGCSGASMLYNFEEALYNIPIDNKIKISYKKVLSVMREFSGKSELFQNTGGVHSAALSDGDNMLVFQEDVGRHNALDKVIGEAFMKGIEFSDKILLLSGRISSEMLTKAAKRNISIVISRSAPMDLALEIGKIINMTIIGFARGERFNLYSGKERIIF
ncbi:MAG: formate dehydrogenase accessory sulfurtransferase FdhD [Firmicutes bacterium]|nr:formate dehydrogenase accessory sulfurtransferase FdhD [Bacillota bacterium]